MIVSKTTVVAALALLVGPVAAVDCVNGKGEFVFRDTVQAHFTLDACYLEGETKHKASGHVLSGQDLENLDDSFIYDVKCMYIDNTNVYLGTQMKRLSSVVEHSQEMEKESGINYVLGGGDEHDRNLGDIGAIKSFFYEIKLWFKSMFNPEPECPVRRNLLQHDDVYSPSGRRYLVADDGEGDEATLAVFYLQSKVDEDSSNQIAVKLHEKFDMEGCASFDQLVKELDFTQVTDDLSTGHITVA